jgi:hypothetical protein
LALEWFFWYLLRVFEGFLMSKPVVICLTPVKNEGMILERFLKCASLWADKIIIADQSSDDGSREIAVRYPKVTLVDNPSPTFNEPERQRILLEEARRTAGPRLLIALDADEVLSANFSGSPEWNTMLRAPAGTVIAFRWVIIRPDLRSYWMTPDAQRFGFMDDGSEHFGKKIHSPRIPTPDHTSVLTLNDIHVIHYVGVDMKSWKSKHRWYQCWERINNPQRRAIDIYRQYHRVDAIPSHVIKPLPRKWLSGYEEQGVDMTSVHQDGILRSEKQILEFLTKHGTRTFKRQAIWDVNWTALYEKSYSQSPPISLSDPRTKFDKWVHRWLRTTQSHYSYFHQPKTALSRVTVRTIEKVLRRFGW